MKGWLIFKHSFSMVLRNWREALKIGLVPVLMVVVIATLTLRSSAVQIAQGMSPDDFEIMITETSTAMGFMVTWLAMLVAFLWIIVNWHRYVLLEEYPQSWIPPFPGAQMLGYFGRMLLIGLLAMAAMIPLGLIIGMLSFAPPLAVAGLIAAYFIVAILIYRVVAILPAAAIGKPIKMGEALAATEGASKDIFVLMLVIFGVSILFQAVASAIMAVSAVLGIVFWVPIYWALALTNVSVLTTFYGHYIEGRPIN